MRFEISGNWNWRRFAYCRQIRTFCRQCSDKFPSSSDVSLRFHWPVHLDVLDWNYSHRWLTQTNWNQSQYSLIERMICNWIRMGTLAIVSLLREANNLRLICFHCQLIQFLCLIRVHLKPSSNFFVYNTFELRKVNPEHRVTSFCSKLLNAFHYFRSTLRCWSSFSMTVNAQSSGSWRN